MKISLAWLKEKGACSDGTNWFKDKFPTGETDYQEVLGYANDNGRICADPVALTDSLL